MLGWTNELVKKIMFWDIPYTSIPSILFKPSIALMPILRSYRIVIPFATLT